MSRAASPGEKVVKHGVTIIGADNLARTLAADSSALFARNLSNFLSAFWDKDAGRPVLPDEDEIVDAIRLTQGGKVVNERLAGTTRSPAQLPDILVIGGCIAGLSAAAALSKPLSPVTVVEAEGQIGFHSSGRSATMLHYALGDRLVRALTLASRPFFDAAARGVRRFPVGHRMPVLIPAREDERAVLDALEADISPFAKLERLDAKKACTSCARCSERTTPLYPGLPDRDGIRIDPHALLQGKICAS